MAAKVRTSTQRKNAARRKLYRWIATIFCEVYSASVFDAQRPKPLAIGTRQRIQSEFPKFKANVLARFLYWWCHRDQYLQALAAEDSYRYHLSGRRGAKVSAQHRRQAQAVLRRRAQTAVVCDRCRASELEVDRRFFQHNKQTLCEPCWRLQTFAEEVEGKFGAVPLTVKRAE